MTTPQTFFSYARADSEFALKLGTDLRIAGRNIWIDQLDIPPGSRWDFEIEKAMQESDSILIILSPNSIVSNNVMDEISYALEEEKRIIPVIFRHCKIPFRLKRLQQIDFSNNYDKGLTNLLLALPEDKTIVEIKDTLDVRKRITINSKLKKDPRARNGRFLKIRYIQILGLFSLGILIALFCIIYFSPSNSNKGNINVDTSLNSDSLKSSSLISSNMDTTSKSVDTTRSIPEVQHVKVNPVPRLVVWKEVISNKVLDENSKKIHLIERYYDKCGGDQKEPPPCIMSESWTSPDNCLITNATYECIGSNGVCGFAFKLHPPIEANSPDYEISDGGKTITVYRKIIAGGITVKYRVYYAPLIDKTEEIKRDSFLVKKNQKFIIILDAKNVNKNFKIYGRLTNNKTYELNNITIRQSSYFQLIDESIQNDGTYKLTIQVM